jgi:ZIP family zinc transporter
VKKMIMTIISIFATLLPMTANSLPILLAALTALATAAGGFLAIKSKDRLHLVLGLAAGLLLGLVAFDLLPEVFAHSESQWLGAPTVSIALIGGFLALHLYERFFGSHEPAESDYGHDHKHSANVAGGLGALAMGGHVFLDGLALAVAFKVSNQLGLAVFLALLVHAFSDGLNTVSLLIKSGHWNKKAIWLIGVDSVARISGAVLGSVVALSDDFIALYLAVFAGIIIYLATSHILPEAHAKHSSRLTLGATVLGVIAMWAMVSLLHGTHGHGEETHGDESSKTVPHDHSDGEHHEDEEHHEHE